MRGVLRRLGFVEEGVMRGFMPSDEGRADYVLFGVTKQEWEARQGKDPVNPGGSRRDPP
jgi:RimJ/RimL family protein N-acetyltransferase